MKLLRYLPFVIALLAPSSAWAAFTVTPITTASQNGGVSNTVTTSSFNVSAGSFVYLAVLDRSGNQASSIQDSLGNNYSIGPNQNVLALGSTYFAFFYYPTAQTGITVTFTSFASSGFGISLFSIVGSNGTEDSGFANVNFGTGTAITVTGTTNPVQSGELLLGAAGWNTSGLTFTQSSGWSAAFTSVTFTASGGATLTLNGGYFVNSGGSNQTYGPSLSGSTTEWGAAIDAVEATSAPPATIHLLPLTGVGQ